MSRRAEVDLYRLDDSAVIQAWHDAANDDQRRVIGDELAARLSGDPCGGKKAVALPPSDSTSLDSGSPTT